MSPTEPAPPSAHGALRSQIRAASAGFDPQQLPLQAPAPQQALLQPTQLNAEAVRARFARGDAWCAPEASEHPWRDQPLTPSAVLIPLVQREHLQVLLTQRTRSLSNHSGQIAFAGGKQDASDANATACALREAQEEIGLAAHAIEILGSLPVYTTGTAFAITPVVALVEPHYTLRLNPQEVDSAFEIDLPQLMNPQHHYRQSFETAGQLRRWYAMPSTDSAGQARFVWGASAGILRNLYHYLLA